MDGKSLRSLNESVSRILFEEDGKNSQQKKIGTYRTRFFHLCPGAQQIFPEIEDEIGGKDAGALAMMADKIFEIEDKVLKAGEPSEEASSAAREVYGELMKAARKFGVDEKLDFMQGHLDIIDKGSKDEEDEEKPGMRGFAGEMDGSLDGGVVDGGMGGGMVGEELDPVGKEDDDIDNDGKANTPRDKYLKNRRKKIGDAIAKKKGKKTVEERKSQILGTLLSEEEGDKEDMEKVVDELKGASKTHLGQSKRLSKYLKGDKKKVNEDMDKFYIQQRDKRFTSEVGKDDPSKITSTSYDTAGARRFTQDQADAIIKRGTDYDVRTAVKAEPDANADFAQDLSDQGVLMVKDHYKHGIHHKELFDDEKTNSYAFMSTMHDKISDPHRFHDLENKGVSAVGFLPKGGVNLDPEKVRAERMLTREHEGLIKKHGIRDIDAKYRYQSESVKKTDGGLQEAVLAGLDRAPKAEVNHTPKTLREATMDRIKKVSANVKTTEKSPLMDRFRGI
jgi:hypothetical protein